MKVLLVFFIFLQINSLKIESLEDIDLNELEKNPELKSKIFMNLVGADENECLPSKEDTKKIMKEKYGIEIELSQITQNLRFIAGKCNPVILVPGILSVRLRYKIDCENLINKEKDIYKKLKFFCRFDNICPSWLFWQTKNDEGEFFLKIKTQFGFIKPINCKDNKDDANTITCQNIYNACFSFFMNTFNRDECAKYSSGKSVCTKSDYIKILFDGGTEYSHSWSKCGIHAVKNILSDWDIETSRIFGDIINLFENLGYNNGFSLGAIPNDFRKFVATNEFATNAFRYLIESFYKNTGKKVIIIAHSFGNLITLHNLVSKENQDLIPKIKKFISIGPPFAGSTKLLNAYLHNLKDFNTYATKFYPFGQALLFKSAPILSELRPLPIFSQLNEKQEYSTFVEAIKERMNSEKLLNKGNYDERLNANSRIFDDLFDSYFPSLDSSICKENNIVDDKYEKKCFLNLFNIFEDPMIIVVDDPQKIDVDSFDTNNYCNSNSDKCFYTNEENKEKKEKKSIEELFTKGKYAYDMPEMNELYKTYYKNQDEYGLNGYMINNNDFESEEDFRKANLLQIEHQKKMSLIKDLPIPPVDTDIVYTSSIKTNTGEFLTDDVLEEGQNFYSGGDGTVSTWSSLLVGLKWIYDKKTKNLDQKIRLVEYCSKLSSDFPYDESSNFIALGCNCLKNGQYKDIDECGHQKMIFDPNLLSYIKQIAEIDEEITEDRKAAANKVLKEPNIDYEMNCNKKLLNLVDPEGAKSSFIGISFILILITIFLY